MKPFRIIAHPFITVSALRCALLGLLLSAFVAPAVATAAVCVSLLTDSELTGVLLEDRALRADFVNRLHSRPTEGPALRLLREIETNHEAGPRLLYALADPSRPHSLQGFNTGNQEGAHQFTALVVGVRVARVLGVSESADGREVTLPLTSRINAGIQWLNRYLSPEQQIHWTFYPDLGKTDGQTYLDRIVEVMGLPISTEVFIHDINFHLGSIAMPNAISNFLRARVNATRDLTRYLLQNRERHALSHPESTPEKWLIEALVNDLVNAEVKLYDEINGNFTFNLALDNLNFWYNRYFSGPHSLRNPAHQLREFATSFSFFPSRSRVLNAWLATQLESYAATHSDPVRPALSLQELQAEVMTRRLALEEAAISVEGAFP